MPESQPLLSTFADCVAGQPVLTDNGAADNYVGAAFAATHKLKILKCKAFVLHAGTEQNAIQSCAQAHVHVQFFSDEVKLYVGDLPSISMQAILGQGCSRYTRQSSLMLTNV